MAPIKKSGKSAAKKAKTAKKPVVKVAPKKAPAKKVAAKKPTPMKSKVKTPPAKKAAVKKAQPQKSTLQKAVKKSAPVKLAPKKAVKPAPAAVSKKVSAVAPVQPPKKEKAVIAKPVQKPVLKVAPKPAVVKPKAAEPRKIHTPPSDRTSMLGPVEVAPYQPLVNEEYMSSEQLDHFRLILNRWKEQLMQEVDSTVGHMKEEAILYPDPLDRAAQEEGFNLELRTRDRERRLIKKIEFSLDKIDNGDYGFCQSCGTEIGLRRLEARPTADKCIDCKTFEEIREKQSGL